MHYLARNVEAIQWPEGVFRDAQSRVNLLFFVSRCAVGVKSKLGTSVEEESPQNW